MEAIRAVFSANKGAGSQLNHHIEAKPETRIFSPNRPKFWPARLPERSIYRQRIFVTDVDKALARPVISANDDPSRMLCGSLIKPRPGAPGSPSSIK
jgi:hypothetical protein